MYIEIDFNLSLKLWLTCQSVMPSTLFADTASVKDIKQLGYSNKLFRKCSKEDGLVFRTVLGIYLKTQELQSQNSKIKFCETVIKKILEKILFADELLFLSLER